MALNSCLNTRPKGIDIMQRWIGWAVLALALYAFYLFVRPAEDPPLLQEKQEAVPKEKAEPQPVAAESSEETSGVTSSLKLGAVLDCTFGENCWIARYSDRDRSKGKADYQCGRRTQNNHKGTDFAVANLGEMKRGVAVLAAAEGTVLRTRDSMQDISVQQTGRKAVKGKECGNAVVIEHVDGLTTQYCHMKMGSVDVAPGAKVKRGQQIGQLGLSGDTEYPHMHLNVRRDGKRIDPFDGQPLDVSCSAGGSTSTDQKSMWTDSPTYQAMDLLPLVFSDKPLTRQSRWEEPQGAILKDAPALILTGIAWNVLEGDEWEFTIVRPDGSRATNQALTTKQNRQSQWYANRLFPPKNGFMKGTWTGKLVVTRARTDGAPLRFESETTVLVTE